MVRRIMPNYGENTGIPGVIKINYPEKGQIRSIWSRRDGVKNKIHEIFNVHHFEGDWDKCFAAARSQGETVLLGGNPRYSRRRVAEILTRPQQIRVSVA